MGSVMRFLRQGTPNYVLRQGILSYVLRQDMYRNDDCMWDAVMRFLGRVPLS